MVIRPIQRGARSYMRFYRRLTRRRIFLVAMLLASLLLALWLLQQFSAKSPISRAVVESQNQSLEKVNQALVEGKLDQAVRLIDDAADPTSASFLDARVRLVELLAEEMAGNRQIVDPTRDVVLRRAELTRTIEKQASLILQQDDSNVVALEQLAAIHVASNQTDSALDYTRRLCLQRPDRNLHYAFLLSQNGERLKANAAAESAVEYFTGQIESDSLSADQRQNARIQLANGLTFLKRFPQAASVLMESGKPRASMRLREKLADVYFDWSESIRWYNASNEYDKGFLKTKLDLLGKALKLKPNEQRILARISTLAGLTGDLGEDAKQQIKSVLRSGNAPAIVYFVLGTNALAKEQWETAIANYQVANRIEPNHPDTLNNLAYSLMRKELPELDRAAKSINKAIELSPQNANFRDTRASIYLLQRRWPEAISDLEYALKAGVGDLQAIHLSLANAYAEIGDDALSKLHAELAEK